MSKTPRDDGSLYEVFSKGSGGCPVGTIAGALTGLLAGIAVAVALGYSFFKGGNDLDHASFISVVVIFGVLGLIAGAWGGAMTAKCWGDD